MRRRARGCPCPCPCPSLSAPALRSNACGAVNSESRRRGGGRGGITVAGRGKGWGVSDANQAITSGQPPPRGRVIWALGQTPVDALTHPRQKNDPPKKKEINHREIKLKWTNVLASGGKAGGGLCFAAAEWPNTNRPFVTCLGQGGGGGCCVVRRPIVPPKRLRGRHPAPCPPS